MDGQEFSRRDFLKMTGIGLTVGSLWGCDNNPTTWVVKRKPNIIFILADDLGYRDLGCYGQTKFDTPNIDQMAREGMRFTDHYAGSTTCAPSRSSLMTGQHTGNTWVRGNYPVSVSNFSGDVPLRAEDTTIAQVLKEAGYRTAMVGKWGLGTVGTTGEPHAKGFDEYFGFLCQYHAHYYYPEYLYKNGQKVVLPGNQNGQRGQYVPELFLKKSLDFIEKNKGRPFFLYLAEIIPHAEMLAPQEAMDEFDGMFPEIPWVNEANRGGLPDGFGAYGDQDAPKTAFVAMVTLLDRTVGRIFEKLKQLNLDNNTLVIFTSDNGPHKEGGHDPVFFNSAGPLRGFKRDLYEGGIRVPMIARWSNKIESDTTSDHVSAFWDFLPTFADIAGTVPPIDIDGLSLLPTFLGKPEQQEHHKYLYWEFHERGATVQAVRMGRWKAIRHSPTGEIELYDLENDRSESVNLANEYLDIVQQAAEYLDQARKESEYWPLK